MLFKRFAMEGIGVMGDRLHLRDVVSMYVKPDTQKTQHLVILNSGGYRYLGHIYYRVFL